MTANQSLHSSIPMLGKDWAIKLTSLGCSLQKDFFNTCIPHSWCIALSFSVFYNFHSFVDWASFSGFKWTSWLISFTCKNVNFTSREWIVYLLEAMLLKTKKKLSLQYLGKSLQKLFKLSASNPLATRCALYVLLLSLNFWGYIHLAEITFWSSLTTSSYPLVWPN